MNWKKLLSITATVALSAVGLRTYSALNREVEQARRLQRQMEEDHALLMRNVIKAHNLIATYEKYETEGD
jgi:hypothetical protein